MTTPRRNSSSRSLARACVAPRILKAPIFCRFSHLKRRLILGPSSRVASAERVLEVRTGVLWMLDLMSESASTTEARVSGSGVEDIVGL